METVSLDSGNLYLWQKRHFCEAVIDWDCSFAFPLIAIEMMSEAAMGILMRVVPQINVFAVNFQVKIAVGLMMLSSDVYAYGGPAGRDSG